MRLVGNQRVDFGGCMRLFLEDERLGCGNRNTCELCRVDRKGFEKAKNEAASRNTPFILLYDRIYPSLLESLFGSHAVISLFLAFASP